MVTASAARRLRDQQAAVATLATEELAAFWASLDVSRGAVAAEALRVFVPSLTTQYGQVSALLSVDWYDAERVAAGVRDEFRAVMGDPVDPEYVRRNVDYASRHLFTATPGVALEFLTGAVQKHVLQPGRDSVTESVRADPRARGWQRFARSGGCDFCVMLAQRGAVYRTERTASFAAHYHCGCVAGPSWDPDAPEVEPMAYRASQRTGALRWRAARGDAAAARQLEEHQARVRAWIESHRDDLDEYRREAGF